MGTTTISTGLYAGLTALIASVKSAWARGPVSCWTEYLQETADK